MPRVIVRKAGEPDRIIDTKEQIITIGRSRKSTVPISDPKASRHQCMIVQEGESYTLVDKGSSNGTMLNGERVTSHPVKAGDAIIIGVHVIFFESIPENAAVWEKLGSPPATQHSGEPSTGAAADSSGPAKGPDIPIYVLEIIEGGEIGKQYRMGTETCTIGRHAGNTIVISDTLVSNYHAEVSKEAIGYFLNDLGSTNGSQVNGQRVVKSPLAVGTEVKIGETRMIFRNIGKEMPEDKLFADKAAAIGKLDSMRGKRRRGVLTYALIIAAAGAIALTVYSVYINKNASLTTPPTLTIRPDNLIAVNPSFEGEDSSDATPEGWKFAVNSAVNVFVDTSKVKTGKKSLAFRNLGGDSNKDTFNEVSLSQPIALLAGHCYKVSAQILTQNAVGFNAMRARVYAKAKSPLYIDYYSIPVSRTHNEFLPSEGTFTMPPWADTVEVTCVATGSRGDIWFDDVRLHEIDPPEQTAFVLLKSKALKLTAFFDRRANFWLENSRNECVAVGRGLLLDSTTGFVPTLLSLQPSLPVAELDQQSMKVSCTGQIFDYSGNEGTGFAFSAATSDKGIAISYKLSSSADRKFRRVALIVAADMSFFGDFLALAEGTKIIPVPTLSVSEPAVEEIMLGKGVGMLDFSMAAPFVASVSKEGEKFAIVELSIPDFSVNKTGTSCSALFLGFSPARNKYFAELEKKANDLFKAGALVEARAMYDHMLLEFPDDPEAKKRADDGIAAIGRATSDLEGRVASLVERIKAAVKNSAVEEFDRLMVELTALADEIRTRLPGTDTAAKTEKALTDIQKLRQDREMMLAEAAAKKMLASAQKAFDESKFVLALAIVNGLIQKYPQAASAADARALLLKVNEQLDSLKTAAKEWETVKSIAETLIRNNDKVKARKQVEDFLKKYPTFIPAQEYLKSLE
ncbi:MAG: FHA domain-containing protein [Candidatus Brocadiia bacterium]